jgi:hypothetical protein
LKKTLFIFLPKVAQQIYNFQSVKIVQYDLDFSLLYTHHTSNLNVSLVNIFLIIGILQYCQVRKTQNITKNYYISYNVHNVFLQTIIEVTTFKVS